jgi:hypothetical protein
MKANLARGNQYLHVGGTQNDNIADWAITQWRRHPELGLAGCPTPSSSLQIGTTKAY